MVVRVLISRHSKKQNWGSKYSITIKLIRTRMYTFLGVEQT